MGGPPNDEPPVKGGQNEALSRTYSEMAQTNQTITRKEPKWRKMVTTCLVKMSIPVYPGQVDEWR